MALFFGGIAMNIGEIMTKNVVTCNLDETLAQVATKMHQENIGLCPVVDNEQLVGVVTDRDITTRAVAMGADVNTKTARSVMTPSPVTGSPSMSFEEACHLMANNQIRRLPIVDKKNHLVGIVALADLAIDFEEEEMIAETLEKISEPAHT